MRITATRRLQYAIGHRVYKHEGKCRHLHGHNFVFFLTAQAFGQADSDGEPILQDDLGRVIDFGVLKEKFDPWFTANWDHGVILYDRDEEALAAMRMIPGQKLYKLAVNPTAENLAEFVLRSLGPQLLVNTGVELSKVVVWETENGVAEASLDVQM